MNVADLKPGHRIALARPSYAPSRVDSLTVVTEPEFVDDGRLGLIASVTVAVDAVEAIGPGELLVRSNAARVAGLPTSPDQYRVSFRMNAAF